MKVLQNKRWSLVAILALASILIMESSTSHRYCCCCVAFVAYPRLDVVRSVRYHPLYLAQDGNSNNNEDDTTDCKDDDKDTNDNPQQQRQDTIPIPKLTYLTHRLRLEEAHRASLLRRPPLKLPYTISQQYIQHNYSHIKTKEQFEQLVNDGELRNVYISKRPEEYYGRRGEWISWDHYLTGVDESGVGRNGTSCLKWQ